MADITIPVIDLEVLTFIGNPIEVEILDVNPIPIEVGMTLPGPKGDPVEIYRSTELPDPEIGDEGALWIKYVPPVVE